MGARLRITPASQSNAFWGEVFSRQGTLLSVMMPRTEHPAASLDDRIADARSQLQRIPEWHPEFECRLLRLIRLVDERDARLAAPRVPATVSGWRCGSRHA
jgi:hypothetical protein